jgi:zinc/manganese transport system substrate-binding protein
MRRTPITLLAVLWLAAAVSARLAIVASTTDLAAIARAVGGDEVQVGSLARGDGNPHNVEVLPSSMVEVARARIYLKVGLGLDPWAQPIIDGSRNPRLRVVDCSRGVAVMNVPQGKVDASMGDVHPEGNPHYWLDPANGLVVAATIRDALCEADPAHAAGYRSGCAAFETRMKEAMAAWRERARPLQGLPVVSFHDSWPYLARAFGFQVVGFVEPRPGIEPTPSHTAELVELIKNRRVPIIIREPYYSPRVPQRLASLTGARVVALAPSVGGAKAVEDYMALFEHDLDLLLAAKGK